MRKYIVYDDNGNILKFGTCPTRDVDMQIQTKTGGDIPKHVITVDFLSNKMDIEYEVDIPKKGTPSIKAITVAPEEE